MDFSDVGLVVGCAIVLSVTSLSYLNGHTPTFTGSDILWSAFGLLVIGVSVLMLLYEKQQREAGNWPEEAKL